MSLGGSYGFRGGAIAATTAASLALSSLFPAYAQDLALVVPPHAPKAQRLSDSDCAVFGKYLLDEARDFKAAMSRTFLVSASRFLRAGCKTSDANGKIEIVTETDQDAASLRTALQLMGRVDVIGLSGVTGCHRPVNGVCPTKASAAGSRPKAGG